METLGRFGHKSLPTYYKGITFRSRLEARWAIVLDELDVSWEYEPEPIMIEYKGCGPEFAPFGYLPDFYLPEYDALLEVKGTLDEKTYIQILQIAHQVSCTAAWYPDHCKKGRPFLLAGPLLCEPEFPVIWSIFNRKGNICVKPKLFYNGLSSDDLFGGPESRVIGDDDSWEMPDEQADSALLKLGFVEKNPPQFVIAWQRAIKKARSTRFDWGHNV